MQAQDAMQGILHQRAHLAYIAGNLPPRLPSTGGLAPRGPTLKGQHSDPEPDGNENTSSNVDAAGQVQTTKLKKTAPRR